MSGIEMSKEQKELLIDLVVDMLEDIETQEDYDNRKDPDYVFSNDKIGQLNKIVRALS